MVLLCAGVVVGVHLQQKNDRELMHKGVLRDKERVLAKKRKAAVTAAVEVQEE